MADWAPILIKVDAHHFQSLGQVSSFWPIPAHGNLSSSGRQHNISVDFVGIFKVKFKHLLCPPRRNIDIEYSGAALAV